MSYFKLRLGGTVDITVHQVNHDGSLVELYKANGGNWGGTYIDKAFRYGIYVNS